MKATIADIKRLAVLIKDQWSLCELFKGTQRAADAEMIALLENFGGVVLGMSAHEAVDMNEL